FRVITMDQRNATGGESTGPVPETDGARAAARRRRAAEPAGRAPAGAAGLHVQLRTRRLGQGFPRAPARRADGNDREIPAQPLPRTTRFRVQRVARLREVVPDADAGAAR